MEVTSIQNGIIIDHVPAGTALKVLEYLKIDPSKTRLALIMNADVRKLKPTLPEHVVNIITCVNPRCVTTTERGIDQMFHLVHSQRQEYRCDYCDEEAKF